MNRTGEAWPARAGAEQAGVVVAYDVASGEYKSIYGMGRHNHENSVAIPGYGHPVVLSGDDTFSAPASQLYLYQAASRAQLWADQGALYAFRSSNAAINDYGDLSGTHVRRGHVHPGAGGDREGRSDGARELVEREQRLPVHPHRGHRLRPHDAERRLLRGHRRAAGAAESRPRAG